MSRKPARSADDRRRAYRAGHGAEFFAAALMMAKGYRILARRFSAHGGEIDLIARRGRVIAFVEVKRRTDAEAAELAITGTKIARFGRAVDAWLMRNPWSAGYVLRADAIFIAPRRWPRHMKNAFELGAG